MGALPKLPFMPEEYLALEDAAEYRSEYVLVSSGRMRVEQHIRRPSGVWTREEWVGPEGVLHLAGVEVEMPLAEIYECVVFPERGAGG